MAEITLRDAVPEDAAAIASIYSTFVMASAATMELMAPDAEEIARRMAEVREKGLPYLVAIMEGEVVGFGYASPFRPREGYRFTVEDSIYVHPERLGRGIGRMLLEAVIEASRKAGCKHVIAVVGGDNRASMAMHHAAGFALVGVLQGAGWKFDKPQDITLMQRVL